MKKNALFVILLCSVLIPARAYGMYYPTQNDTRSDISPEVRYEANNESYGAGETENNNLDTFIITSGIVKDCESTFDIARTITGTAEWDTCVIISVYQLEYSENAQLPEESEPEIIEIETYNFTVGSSGIFSRLIEFPVGENHIRIVASKDNRTFEKTVVINRKDMDIKLKLEQGIALPGKKK